MFCAGIYENKGRYQPDLLSARNSAEQRQDKGDCAIDCCAKPIDGYCRNTVARNFGTELIAGVRIVECGYSFRRL